jgi:hypothetical protein
MNSRERNDLNIQIREYKKGTLGWLHDAERMVTSLYGFRDSELWKNSDASSYPTGETLRGAFTRTMISNETPLNADPDDNLYMELWRQVIALHQQNNPRYPIDAKTFNYNSTCTYTTTGRVFFHAENRLISLASPGTCAGDVICHFSGAVTPFIPRKIHHVKENHRLRRWSARRIFMV